jgi:predicted HicB family RNase H-like nuclease
MQSQAEPAKAEKPATKTKPIGVTVRFTPAQHAALRKVSYETRVSLNSLIMEGVASVLQKHGR